MANCRQSFCTQVGQVVTWHPADALEQSEAASNLANKLESRQPVTTPGGAWPTQALARTRKLQMLN
ncbi:DUF1589 domain-containing protein [Rhodopirellula sp. P2]|uniref:DUF1589 domain-containing protein n=1 Tax=Rhodopirellula sp. P2 TaxID=2127060 RepID=UPI003FD11907